jgi:putative transposase
VYGRRISRAVPAGERAVCYPLTILDGHSALSAHVAERCRLLRSSRRARVFAAAFEEFGLPEVIYTDNGVPFAGPNSVLGLTRLSVWLLKLGIRLERSRRGKPQDNGAHECMHRTLKAGACRRPRATFSAQQRALNEFRRVYNEERPHHALGMRTPASLYTPSERPYTRDIPDPVYPRHFETRRITKIGIFSWHRQQIIVTQALHNEVLGFEWVADQLWSVFFGRSCWDASTRRTRNSSRAWAVESVTHVPGLKCYPCPRLFTCVPLALTLPKAKLDLG